MLLVGSVYGAISVCLDFYLFSPILANGGGGNLLYTALGLKVKQIIALRFVAMTLVRRTSE